MKLKKLLLVAGLALVSCHATSVAAPPKLTPVPTVQSVKRDQWKWANLPWTDRDQPYLQVRSRIGDLYRAKRIGRPEVEKAKAKSLANPKDVVARFAWAYTVYCFSLLQSDRANASGLVGEVAKDMAAHTTPKSYQYARLRFLITCSPVGTQAFSYGTEPYLKQLGERLLKRDPKDQGVKTCQITNLRTGQPEDEKKAIQYAQDLVAANPQEAYYYSILGFTYQWTRIGRKGDGPQRAVDAYEKALSLSKAPGEWRQKTQNNIDDMRKKFSLK